MTSHRSARVVDVGVAVAAVLCFLRADLLPFAPQVRGLAAASAFLLAPIWLWRLERRDADGLIADALRRGVLHNLVVLALLALTPIGLTMGTWLWSAGLLVPLWFGRHRRALRPGVRLWWLGGALVLATWLGLSAQTPSIWSDAPAHLAAVHDALEADAWIPPDLGPDGGVDPRFGVAHGLYAALASGADVSPAVVLAMLPLLLAPLWWGGHAHLFRVLGAPMWMAWMAATLFTLGGAGGRGFGLWSSSYPGNLAMALALPGLAAWIDGLVRRDMPRAIRGMVAVTLTALIHPFAWWGATMGLLLTAVFLGLRPSTRGIGLRGLGLGVASVALGAGWMLPRLLDRGASAGGIHFQVTDALTVGRFFIVDPYWLMRWGGSHVLWAWPLALVVPSAWNRRTVFVFALASMPWWISLNPLLQPLAWDAGSYLSVRLVRFTYVALAAGLVGAAALARLRRSTGLRLLVPAVGLLAAGWLAGTQVASSWNVLRPPPVGEAGVWETAAGIHAALDSLGSKRFLADPRTSYAVRALGSAESVLYPVAHASPRDSALAARLRGFRSLFDPSLPADSLRATLRALDADVWVLDPGAARSYPREDFGYQFDRGAVEALRTRLSGVQPAAQVSEVTLFRVEDILTAELAAAPSAVYPPAPRDLPGIEGASYRVVDVQFHPDRVAAGGDIDIDVWYEKLAMPKPVAHPEWEQVTLRFEGPMQAAPQWAAPVGKLVRKLVLERSGRSPARFQRSWFPFEGTFAPTRWDGVVHERRRIRVPAWATPGSYSLQPTVHDAPWRTRAPLTDYLRDRDSRSGPGVGVLEVESP